MAKQEVKRMILLNPEEIEVLSEWWLKAPEETDWAETLLRAQLKKVVEYLEPNIGIRLDAPHKTTIDLDAWTILKKVARIETHD